MKRLLAGIMLAAVFVVSLATAASAARFSNPEPIKWKNENYSNAGGIAQGTPRDTLTKPIKVGATDTTGVILTEGWAYPDGAVADSVVLGTLWVQADSTASVAGIFTATSFTVTPQYSTGTEGSWTSGAAITFTDVTANDLMLKIPIYYVGNVTRGLINAAGWPAPKMRYLIVAVGGVVSPARLYLTHLLPGSSN
jgi:hypothetical protein